jgi:hypothetical protein
MRTALFASFLLTLACGGDDGLAVTGDVTVDADGTPTGFEFVETTKLLDLTYEEDSGTVMAGRCVVQDGVDDSVTLTLQAPGEPPEGVGLHRFQVTFTDVLPGSVQAQLGTDDYTGMVGGGSCSGSILYRDDDDRAVGAEVDCELTGPDAATASLTADLHFTGCTVERLEE